MGQHLQHEITPTEEMANEGSTEIAQGITEMVHSDQGNTKLVEATTETVHSNQGSTETVHSVQGSTEMVHSDQGSTELTETMTETIQEETTPREEMTGETASCNAEIEEVSASSTGSIAAEVANDDVNSGNERVVEISGNLVNRRQLGGMRTMPFVFASEIGQIFAAMGSHSNIVMYLTGKLHLPVVKAVNINTTFSGISNFLPLLGALIADSFAGRFWTIIVASFIYEMGMIALLMTAVVPSLQPPPCPSQEDCQQAPKFLLWLLYISFLLTAIGGGGLRPCVSTFAADQLDISKASGDAKTLNFFNWYSFGSSLASLTAMTILAYIQQQFGWAWGFGIPTVAWAISIIAFLAGAPLYLKNKPGRSPWVRLAQVTVAAFKKRELVVPRDSSLLYRNRELDASISTAGCISQSSQFTWLDKAAIITEEERAHPRNPNLWRLNTVHRVEELKSIIRILPILASGILPAMTSSPIGSFVLKASNSMNRKLAHSFEVPPITMGCFGFVTVIIGLVAYDRALVPMVRRFTGKPAGITPLQRIGIGFSIHIVATLISAAVETKRKNVAAEHSLLDIPNATIPISVFWLCPQYIVHGIAEVFASAGHMEYLYSQSPESMRSTVQGLNGCMTGIGNFLGVALLSFVKKLTGPENIWFPEWNINRGKLDSFYYLSTVIQAVNLIYFVIVAWYYVPKHLEERENDTADVDDRDADVDEGRC